MNSTKEDSLNYIVGIDEVGRGPIAGPVCVCAFGLKKDRQDSFINEAKITLKLPLRDSKKLTKKQREKWFSFLRKLKEEGVCDYAVSFVSNEMIDKYGIKKCIQKALDKSIDKLIGENFKEESISEVEIFLDGGLKAPDNFTNQKSIIKGDELHPIISLASVVAKVSRDKIMENYSKEYKEYHFEKNSGYGTKDHYEAIKNYGITKIHRISFLH